MVTFPNGSVIFYLIYKSVCFKYRLFINKQYIFVSIIADDRQDVIDVFYIWYDASVLNQKKIKIYLKS